MAELQSLEGPSNGLLSGTLVPYLGSKRVRRPSVRLGEIGEQRAYESYAKKNKQLRVSEEPKSRTSDGYLHHGHNGAIKAVSKRKASVNLGNGDSHESRGPEEENQSHDLGSNEGNLELVELKAGEPKGSTTHMLESPENATTNVGFSDSYQRVLKAHGNERESLLMGKRSHRKSRGARITDSNREPVASVDCVEMVGLELPSDAEDRSKYNGDDELRRVEKCGRKERKFGGIKSSQFLDDEVWGWLNEMGLGRYAPVFEMHEVDYAVLPLLTLDDLKDMGINAVGSRRKMYCAIQKLRGGIP
ncbi:protein bicaudal C homolog 1 [Amborella trichopoda]|uniref:SAM domain-containing protein n=1 Tax=Amborella trichopoda TaxID=13333 RepID=W1PGI1_AMBTC|nr:protein bicaudal C homolog 1 [Amborella trichopoda]XP_011623413.1 protein bicaudal C homolog 1 [Amborella trichopoda]ERN06185.1 hypothetical protein AMTR_s00016p00140810 [Amborella trichopoda]|eukprot:XP_006844510.1 protein bicaudal C homolog 1 [Amborella trichopoda]